MTFSLDAHINKVAMERAMTPALERAARAAANEFFHTPWDDMTPTQKGGTGLIIRAILLALREPSEAMKEAHRRAYHDLGEIAVNQWQAMIDAILGDKP